MNIDIQNSAPLNDVDWDKIERDFGTQWAMAHPLAPKKQSVPSLNGKRDKSRPLMIKLRTVDAV